MVLAELRRREAVGAHFEPGWQMAALEEYRSKRDLKRSPEPRGRKVKRSRTQRSDAGTFTVQKHDATTLHYDFRLELDGVLLSWAVPKGPSLDPSDKRLAIQTEDHPLEYGAFEGVIPAGHYGAGTVLVWDHGTWAPDGDARAGYRKGHLNFALDGQKLRGRWHLVRRGGTKQWLLFKSRDQFAKQRNGGALVEQAPDSVISGQSLSEVAAAAQVHPSSTDSAKSKARRRSGGKQRQNRSARAAGMPGARREKLPESISPELATLVTEVPEGDDWLHEMKFDGYRILLHVEGRTVRCLTRRGNDWSDRLPHLVRDVADLDLPPTLIDGELCVVESDGTTNFQRLQNSLNAKADGALVYFAFDLLHHDGTDLRSEPLVERKRALEELLSRTKSRRLSLSQHVVGHGPAFFREVCERGLEGIVCKRVDSRYRSERTRDWLKVKCVRRHEVVIGGYTDPGGSRSHLGALLVGTHDEQGALVYRGKVGTGFSEQTLRELHQRLEKLGQKQPPFTNAPRGAAIRDVHWVKPELLAEVEYAEITQDGKLRHPRFRGLRQDKPADAVKLEPPGNPAPRNAARSLSSADLPVELTHPDRVLYASQGLTKAALAEYFVRVADWMLPHVQGRILTLVRCPRGQGGECFFQKHAGKGIPEALRTVEIQEQDKLANYLVLDDVAGLVSLVQMGALEVHVWGARADRPERPDQLVFDLDPGPGVAWGDVIAAALTVRDQLAELGLESFVKTSGGKGLHVVAPVERRVDWDVTKTFCHSVAERICHGDPKKFVCSMSKAKREGRIFIDYLRNSRGATSVCAYSPRAREGAPVSTPLAWSELTEGIRPSEYTVLTLPDRVVALATDPWARYAQVHQSITKQMLRRLGAV